MTMHGVAYRGGMPATTENTQGKFLASRRAAKGWTQKQLADAVGVDRLAVSQWENDRNRPSPENATRLAQLFGGEPADFGYEAPAPPLAVGAEPPSWFTEAMADVHAKLDEILQNQRRAAGRR